MNLDMTLREFFELAERVGNAAQTIREAQAMLGGAPVAPSGMAGIMALPRNPAREPSGVDRADVLLTNKGPVTLTDEEKATRERLRMEREQRDLDAMPDNIKQVMQS